MLPRRAVANHEICHVSHCRFPRRLQDAAACRPDCGRITRSLELLDAPIATAEFLVVDTETNGLGGDACEMTEVGAVLVGGGELHDRWDSLVRTRAPLRRGIQRFTGITQAMVDGAPYPEAVLPQLAERLRGRVMVAHNAPFDRRVLRQAFERVGLEWPNPPVLCTAALARTLLPLQRRRGLRAVADALGIDVDVVHRALADAETCARVLCALFPRLCANALTIARRGRDAGATRPARRPSAPSIRAAAAPRVREAPASSTSRELPRDPGVYLFRDGVGPDAVRRQVGVDPQPGPRALRAVDARRPSGPRTPRSSTTGRLAPSSARWCSRTG